MTLINRKSVVKGKSFFGGRTLHTLSSAWCGRGSNLRYRDIYIYSWAGARGMARRNMIRKSGKISWWKKACGLIVRGQRMRIIWSRVNAHHRVSVLEELPVPGKMGWFDLWCQWASSLGHLLLLTAASRQLATLLCNSFLNCYHVSLHFISFFLTLTQFNHIHSFVAEGMTFKLKEN